ncbi:MAG: hypothetical protein U0165_04255 [Polyangiaceae bacterium]
MLGDAVLLAVTVGVAEGAVVAEDTGGLDDPFTIALDSLGEGGGEEPAQAPRRSSPRGKQRPTKYGRT